MEGVVRAVLRGPVAALGRTRSAIGKRPVDGPVWVGALGMEGDEQADRRVHGGVDKALHCYAWSHYGSWRHELPDCAVLQAPGAFGENLCLDGLEEHLVCLGDRWRIGTVILVVSQGRQPCFKLNVRFGVPDMAARVQNSLRAGWYLRVEQEGELQAGQSVKLLDRPHPAYSVARLLAMIRDRTTDAQQVEPVLRLPLPDSWRRLFERRLQSGSVESWAARMEEPLD